MSSHVPKKIARATRGAKSIKVLSTSISLLYVGMRPPPHRTDQIGQAWSNDSTDGSQHYSGPAREFYRAEGFTATVNVRVSENLVTSVHLCLMLWKTEAKHFNYLQLSKWKKECNSGSVRSRETNAPDGCGTARLDSASGGRNRGQSSRPSPATDQVRKWRWETLLHKTKTKRIMHREGIFQTQNINQHLLLIFSGL